MANGQAMTLGGPGFNLRPLFLLFGIAGAVAAGVAVMLWWQGPNWSLLYGNLEASDASQVTQSLQASGIKYKINDATGAIMVPADQVHEARLKLAGQGLPGSSSGIDLINKDSGLGVSQFMENARYQYALETELARTISSLRNVVAARVHLAIAQQSAFVRDRRPSGASVLLQLRPGGRLEPEQVQAVVHLVASSIPDLSADNVTIVDQQGRLLSSPGNPQSTIQTEQFAAAQRIEESYAQRIEELLVPMVGTGRVRAQVKVDLDPSEAEESHEQYKPDSAIVRSEQTSEQVSPTGAGAAGGVPGALTNQPPAGGTVASPASGNANAPAGTTTPANGKPGAAGAQAAVAATPENTSKSATRNFEIDRTISYTRQPGGRIKRMTVAVLLDNPVQAAAGGKPAADGKPVTVALTPAQIEDITRLVKGAVGFDEQRGDSVSVVNAAFHDEHEELTPEAVPIWQKPMVQDIARLVLGAVVLLVIALGVLRPMIRNLTTATMSAMPVAEGAEGAAAVEGPAGAPAVTAPPGTPLAYEQQIVQAKTIVAQDPKRVAQVVKNWVGE